MEMEIIVILRQLMAELLKKAMWLVKNSSFTFLAFSYCIFLLIILFSNYCEKRAFHYLKKLIKIIILIIYVFIN